MSMVKTVYIYNVDGETNSEATCDVIKNADGKLFVDCVNTKGVPFVEAGADFSIDKVGDITVPDTPMLEKFIYSVPGVENILEMPLKTAQLTRFNSGAFVLGMAINHSIVDGQSAMEFVNSWAETARGVSQTIPPVLDNSVFTSRKPSTLNKNPTEKLNLIDITDVSNLESLYQKENTIYKSFGFEKNRLTSLKK
ncbi:hypothetical protein Pint_07150 [Pistacia integerrima]|uniref:Uncharacterized protein n=1 Tax=Pistacia integerrima TaxID=434235 RepID=A0ACC0XXQ3_9ROSI|nr:hypothetical protein Pint_07150 [Pistacia integerrima]